MAPSKNAKSAVGIKGREVGFGLSRELTRGAPSLNYWTEGNRGNLYELTGAVGGV